MGSKIINKQKVLLIGLDGGTYKIIDLFIKEGLLPNLKQMMETGSYGILESTIPPITAPAWASFMTGKNPGKHGIIQFYDVTGFNDLTKKPSLSLYDADINIVNYSTIKQATIFDVFKRSEKEVISINIPMTYPTPETNGHVISCWLTPPDVENYTFPKSLKNEIPGYRIDQHFGEKMFALPSTKSSSMDSEFMFRDLTDVLKKRKETALKLLLNKPWDLFMICFTETDRIQHYFWRVLDEEYYDYTSEIEKEKESFRAFFVDIDNAIGELVNASGKNTSKMIISDHGFTSPAKYRFHINKWLQDLGLLSVVNNNQDKKKENQRMNLIKHLFPFFFRKKIENNETEGSKNVDWISSKAWGLNLNRNWGGIYIMSNHRDNKLLGKIRKSLLDVEDILYKRKIVENVYTREELYSGPYTDIFSDLVFKLYDDYEAGIEGQIDISENSIISHVRPYPNGRGNHDREGIYILTDGVFKQMGLSGQYSIQDIFPTILYLLNLPIPEDIDGRVALDLIDKKYKSLYPVKWEQPLSVMRDKTDAEQDKEAIKDRLRNLGYL